MVYYKELWTRIKKDYGFSLPEISGLVIAALAVAFIFSFRDWGEEQFDFLIGLQHLIIAIVLVAVSLSFRFSCQKVYGLAEGYKAEFKVWWTGIIISLILAFITLGKLPLVLVGTMAISFMVKLRLGEFRYGFSYWTNGVIALWGIIGNLILAILFAIGLYFFPQSYPFDKGMMFNIIMAWCSLLPLPQLDGMNIFFASRGLYYLSIFTVALGSILLLSGTKIGLIVAIIIGLIAGGVYILIGSEK
ncbi:hypothetical protein HZC32_01995 [Candidatus Woesearchaeota archaeon]|nr:hypothetical protein [Candidatus Woesearchaeota archaeon]